MRSIFICDDEVAVTNYIKDQAEKQILIHQYGMGVEYAGGNPELLLNKLEKIREKGNIYLLDVELNHPLYDGFLLGKEIRRIDPQGVIIYITGYGNLAYKTFKYHIEAFDYIVKDVGTTGRAVADCLRAVTERMKDSGNQNSDSYYTFRSGDIVYHIPKDDILYFETSSRSHFVTLQGKCRRIEFMGSLSDIADELGEDFIKIHRSYLVAVDKIDKVNLKSGTVTVGGCECPVSRKEKKGLLRRLEQR